LSGSDGLADELVEGVVLAVGVPAAREVGELFPEQAAAKRAKAAAGRAVHGFMTVIRS
jgi:hypothetical protein